MYEDSKKKRICHSKRYKINLTRLLDKTITSIKQPIEQLAEQAVNIMIDLIEEREVTNNRVMLEVTLQKGDTI